ncbi:tRNA pseudouridine(38-40) synthase TruA [Deinococcus sp. KNUC1210]|uniref:tRNA pseudouridine(38-40) synthase TruA n=1 Tax=Deinococcus sp. KNUC1210 TaxID=2917691 RepID=UPI001EEF8C28|nr:tRNA pseudouridine(38-40) synthase TruA [Deinococcus sp. KNUC1210]ULH14672.1 tRNA pseudouridine(38-40) synthase TruA [Deinococcus sp. KNUC1210]
MSTLSSRSAFGVAADDRVPDDFHGEESGPTERRVYAPPPGFVRYRLNVQWDGSGFVGWQSQPGQRSVQDTLQAALPGKVEAARPVAAGRTDAGVHAEAMTLHWDISQTLRLSPERLQLALNGRLPPDLVVLSLSVAPVGFHARYRCTGRAYVYRVLNTPQRRPLWQGRALHVPSALNVAAMQTAALQLVGDHDFAAFATREERQTRRTLHTLEVQRAGGVLELHIAGESFLRQMVRCLVGTLLAVGRGDWTAEDVGRILASADRTQAGPNVPPHGLYFAGATYPAFTVPDPSESGV